MFAAACMQMKADVGLLFPAPLSWFLPLSLAWFLLLAPAGIAQSSPPGSPSAEKRSMEESRPDATFIVGGDPDWMAVSDDAVWVSIASLNRVTRLDAATNASGISVAVNNPCSGLAVG